ncbi:MAG: Holliday junction branch migration protein RuvA [Candidatus Margulisbacteria bacterium]|nr:Holliday junction branch migration protein RuvA [Candidatus Margulisiibacteriota bacterium]
MIGSLEGIIELKDNGLILINVQGVGYQVFFPKNLEILLPDIGEKAKIYTYHHITENAHNLYGFLTLHQKKLFLMLISVSGVGPKIAMHILSEVPVEKLIKAIAHGDSAFISRLHGIGKKTSERLIIDLKDKILSLAPDNFDIGEDLPSQLALPTNIVQDVSSALTSLGYNAKEIKAALSKLKDVKKEDSAENIIRQVLKHL